LPTEKTLFPVWPIVDAERAAWLFGATMAVLLAPKLFGLLLLMRDRALRRGFGGLGRAFLGVLVETVYSGLCAPILMLVQSRFVLEVLFGHDSGWKAQIRDDRGIPFGETLRRHGGHMFVGCVLGTAAWMVAPALLAWMSPAVAGLVFAAPISYIGARLSWGLAARRLGVLTIPEETAAPLIVTSATERFASLADHMAQIADPLREVLTNKTRFMLHAAVVGQGLRDGAAGDPRLAEARHVLAERARDEDPLTFLDNGQLLSVFGDPKTLLAVRRRVHRPRRPRGQVQGRPV
jgi:membrane glycosyltransferase